MAGSSILSWGTILKHIWPNYKLGCKDYTPPLRKVSSVFQYSFCPGDGIGIRVGLRSQILGVRVSSGAPSLDVIVGTSRQKYLPMTCFEHEGWFDSNSIHQVLLKC